MLKKSKKVQVKKPAVRRRRKKENAFAASADAVISTPLGRAKTKLNKLKFDVSPIRLYNSPLPVAYVNNTWRKETLPSLHISDVSPDRFLRKRVIELDLSEAAGNRVPMPAALRRHLQAIEVSKLTKEDSRQLILTLSLPKQMLDDDDDSSNSPKKHKSNEVIIGFDQSLQPILPNSPKTTLPRQSSAFIGFKSVDGKSFTVTLARLITRLSKFQNLKSIKPKTNQVSTDMNRKNLQKVRVLQVQRQVN